MNNPKKQHYVPQTYLRQFTEIQGNFIYTIRLNKKLENRNLQQ